MLHKIQGWGRLPPYLTVSHAQNATFDANLSKGFRKQILSTFMFYLISVGGGNHPFRRGW